MKTKKEVRRCVVCGLKVVYSNRWGWKHIFNDRKVSIYYDIPFYHNARVR
jgi:hypothetical protein